MPLINAITLLLIYQLAGEVSVRLLGLPVPGPVVGMVMLFITLMIRGQMVKAVEPASSALLGHLSLLFVPAGVGLLSISIALATSGCPSVSPCYSAPLSPWRSPLW